MLQNCEIWLQKKGKIISEFLKHIYAFVLGHIHLVPELLAAHRLEVGHICHRS